MIFITRILIGSIPGRFVWMQFDGKWTTVVETDHAT